MSHIAFVRADTQQQLVKVWKDGSQLIEIQMFLHVLLLYPSAIDDYYYGRDGSSSFACLHHRCEGMWNAGAIGRR